MDNIRSCLLASTLKNYGTARTRWFFVIAALRGVLILVALQLPRRGKIDNFADEDDYREWEVEEEEEGEEGGEVDACQVTVRNVGIVDGRSSSLASTQYILCCNLAEE
jgi:hypothetical protein